MSSAHRAKKAIGILREVKNKWERRSPLVPKDVQYLTQQKGVQVIVQPSDRRIFTDDEYQQAGAIISDDLSATNCILGVKEFPAANLIPNKSYLIFSHTIKAQPYNMPFLDSCLTNRIRLFDYECIRAPEEQGGQRLVAFGKYAGICGMIDCFRGLGARLLSLGYSTSFMGVASSYMYPSVEDAYSMIRKLGEEISRVGVPASLSPVVFGFTGNGNVTQGALDVFKLLPHKFVTAAELPQLMKSNPSRFQVYGVMLGAQDMVVPAQAGVAFNKADYYANPQNYRPVFHERIAPYLSVLVNGMYWDAKFPRLLTLDQMEQLEKQHPSQLKMVADISCDIGGSVEFLMKSTTLDQPYFVYDPLTRQVYDDVDGRGVLMLGVDNLPTSVPREASQHFSKALTPFVSYLAEQDLSAPFESLNMPSPIKNACITSNGSLTPSFQYIAKLRKQKEAMKKDSATTNVSVSVSNVPFANGASAASTIDTTAPSSKAVFLLEGHLFDSGLINQALNLIEVSAVDFKVLHWEIGPNKRNKKQTSSAVIQVHMADAASMDKLLSELHMLGKLTPSSQASIQQLPFGSTNAVTGAADSTAPVAVAVSAPTPAAPSASNSPAPASTSAPSAAAMHVTPSNARHVLVLGSGYVSAPVVDYLTRSSHVDKNEVTVASLQLEQARALCANNAQARPMYLDASDQAAMSKAVREHDIVISLLPATAHLPVARECLTHRKNLVTASYISPDMRKLHEAAARAGLCFMNEVGLDPGIDHMSAMSIIDHARDTGARVVSFESLCGGLPAPEAANNPLAYKFSWSPRGVLLAAQNAARFKQDGKMIEIPGADLLKNAKPISIMPSLNLEHLANRDSMHYGDVYGIAEQADTVYRGTLRYAGFSTIMFAFQRLGLLDLTPRSELAPGSTLTWLSLLTKLFGASSNSASEIRSIVSNKLSDKSIGLTSDKITQVTEAMEWLGLISDRPVDARSTVLDTLCALLQEKLTFQPHERDMVLLYHRFILEHADKSRERITSSLLAYGDNQYSAMARTVGFPTAISAQYIMDGIITRKGVLAPIQRDVYVPILRELKKEGIVCVESKTPIVL